MFGLITSVALSLSPNQPGYDADFVEGQQVAFELVEAYANHPAGSEVMDYFSCHFLYMEDDNVLFLPTRGVFLSPEQIWDIDRSAFTYRHNGRSDEFWNIVNAFVKGEVLTRFAEIGVEGCRNILAERELSREEYFEFLAEGDD